MEYCPQCIEPLNKQTKKLGGLTLWLICPKCGLRTREKSYVEERNEMTDFLKYKVLTNSNNQEL